MNKRLKLILPCLALLFAVGCAGRHGPSEEMVESKSAALEALAASRVVSVVQEPYLGAQAVRLPKGSGALPGVFLKEITLNRRGTLAELCAAIGALADLPVYAPGSANSESSGGSGRTAQSFPSSGAMDADLRAALGDAGQNSGMSPPPSSGNKQAVPAQGVSYAPGSFRVNYTGTVKGLLDLLAARSGYSWEYSAENGVSFNAANVRTFTILAAPGKVGFSNKITNQSNQNSSGGSSAAGGNSQESSMETAQTNTTDLSFDVWKDVETEVKSLISKNGTVTINQAAGTVTVKDNPQTLLQVERYITALNEKLGRQVALSIKVWSLEVEDSSDIGVNLQMFFENPSVKVFAGASPLKFLNAGGDLSAAVVDGKLKDSTALLKGLRSVGRATQVTSGGGVVMSNQPVPVQAIKREAYLARSSKSQTDYGQTTELQPGEVTTGFAMTVIPHILEGRRVILQYTVNLSNLDDLTEFKSGESTIQLPKVSTRSFAQRMTLKIGQTLVLAGFEQEQDGNSAQGGILGIGKSRQYRKSLIVITISTESGEV